MASIQALVCCLHLVLVVAGVQGQAESDDWPCDHQVFCNPGEEGILHTVQMSGLFNDSKTFVDMQMNYDTETVQSNFDKLPDKNDVSFYLDFVVANGFQHLILQATLRKFLSENFSPEGTELEKVTPTDWTESPEFIENISDENLKELATNMNNIWKNLTRYNWKWLVILIHKNF